MKFLNKLFKKGEEEILDTVIDEAFPAGEIDELGIEGAFGESYGTGYEDALGPVPIEQASAYQDAPPLRETPPAPECAARLPEPPANEWTALRLKLQAEPRSSEHHQAVRRAIPLRNDRVDFYEELANTYQDEVYHSLSLGRAYRAAGQNQEAVAHYQRYLRATPDAEAFEELADVYGAVGQAYLSSSARSIAQSIRSKGGDPCSSS